MTCGIAPTGKPGTVCVYAHSLLCFFVCEGLVRLWCRRAMCVYTLPVIVQIRSRGSDTPLESAGSTSLHVLQSVLLSIVQPLS